MCINEYIVQSGIGETYQVYVKKGAAFFHDRGVVTPNESDYAAYSAHLAEIYHGKNVPERCEKAVNALKKFYAWRDGNTADTTDGEEVRLIDGNTADTTDGEEVRLIDGNTADTTDGEEVRPIDGNTADTTDGEEVRPIDFMKLCVRIDRAYGFALKSVASANGETIAEVVVSAIAAYLHKHSKQAKRAFDIYYNR